MPMPPAPLLDSLPLAGGAVPEAAGLPNARGIFDWPGAMASGSAALLAGVCVCVWLHLVVWRGEG